MFLAKPCRPHETRINSPKTDKQSDRRDIRELFPARTRSLGVGSPDTVMLESPLEGLIFPFSSLVCIESPLGGSTSSRQAEIKG